MRCVGEHHPSVNEVKVSQPSSQVQMREHVIFQYESMFPFNKPVINGMINGKTMPFLLDSGADITLISMNAVKKLRAKGKMKRLAVPCICFPFDKRPKDGPVDPEDLPPAMEHVVVVQLSFLVFDISFPIHCHPADLPIVMIGNDLMSFLNIAINATASEISIPINGGEDKDRYLKELNRTAQERALQYQQRLVRHNNRQGSAMMITEGSAQTTTHIEKASRIMCGVDKRMNEHLLFPVKSCSVNYMQPVRMTCLIHDFTFRKGGCYFINSNEWKLGDSLEIDHQKSLVYQHELEDSPFIDLIFTTNASAKLFKSNACAVVTRMHVTKSAALQSLSTMNGSVSKEITPDYPQESSFQPITLYDELPIDDLINAKEKIRDYSEEEKKEALDNINELIVEKDGKKFMNPKKNVFLPVLTKELVPLKHALLCKMLSTLPITWFQEDETVLPGIPMTDVAIRVHLLPHPPIAGKMRKMSPTEAKIAREYFEKEIALGLFEFANSEWSANVTWAPKPDASLRLCLDFRRINGITKKDKNGIPRMEVITGNIAKKDSISLVDLTRGFNNLNIHPDYRDFLAFNTPLGQLRPIRLPFGWCNGPPCFQRQVDLTLGPIREYFLGYIDDLSGGTTGNQRLHDMLLCTMLFNFAKRGFRFHAKKAQLLADMLHLVGYSVNGEGLQPSPAKGIFDILLTREHSTLKSIQKTLGTLQWFKPFVPNFSYTVRSLTRLLRIENRNGNKVVFTEDCKIAIETVKEAVEKLPTLRHPDPSLPKIVDMACGLEAFAVAIYQVDEASKRQIIEFWSRKWVNDVSNYNKCERYSLCVREVVKHYHSVLNEAPSVTFYSNEQAFIAIANEPDAWSPRMMKFLSYAIQYSPKYRTPPAVLQRDLDILNEKIPSDEINQCPVEDI